MLTTWYSAEVQKQMESGNSTDETEVDLRLSVLKAILPGWPLQPLDNMRKRRIAKEWSKAGKSELV